MNAFTMSFDQWPPASVPVRHGITAPVGAIRLARKGKSQVRQIKVRMTGYPASRWMNLARFWWIRNKGPVPEGMRVGHFDGDTLNDDPTNYALFTAGDMIASVHLDRPAWSARQHKRAAAACAEANRARAQIIRASRPLRGRWYGVDLERRVIINQPHRKRWQVYAAAGIAIANRAMNGRGYEAAALGWAGVPLASAAVLAVLAGGEATLVGLWAGVQTLLQRHGWLCPTRRDSLKQYLTPIRQRGWLTATRGHGRRRTYQITEAGAAARQVHVAIVARRGDELEGEAYRLFELLEPGQESGVAA